MNIVYEVEIDLCLWEYWEYRVRSYSWHYVSPYSEFDFFKGKDPIDKIDNALFIAGIKEIV